MASQCTAEGVGRQQYLLRLSELEFIDRHQRMTPRRIAVTDGTGVKAGRLDPPSNIRWRVTAEPDSNGDVTIALPVAPDCAGGGATCTGDGRKLSDRLEFTVSPEQ